MYPVAKPLSHHQLLLRCHRQVGVVDHVLEYERVDQVFQNPHETGVRCIECRVHGCRFEKQLNLGMVLIQRLAAKLLLSGDRLNRPVGISENMKLRFSQQKKVSEQLGEGLRVNVSTRSECLVQDD